MLVFPQLTTGAAALYPVTRQSALRTVVNTLGDGSTVVYDEPGDVRLDIGQPVRLAFDGTAAHLFGPDGMTLRG